MFEFEGILADVWKFWFSTKKKEAKKKLPTAKGEKGKPKERPLTGT